MIFVDFAKAITQSYFLVVKIVFFLYAENFGERLIFISECWFLQCNAGVYGILGPIFVLKSIWLFVY